MGNPYYPNGNESTALIKYVYDKPVKGSKVAHLGTFTGGIPSIDPNTGKESVTETQVCGIDIIPGTKYPLVLRSDQRVLLRSNLGNVMIMAGGQVGIWGDSIKCNIPAKDQHGIYARFA